MTPRARFLAIALTALLALPLTATTDQARAKTAAELALVLLTDVSNSMDSDEYDMVKAGYRAAFSDPEVISAISNSPGGVAVAYVEFSDANRVVLVKGWDLLTDEASANAFGEAVARAPRSSAGSTALAASLRQAARLLIDGDYADARRLVIDVTSDHPNDNGRSAPVRDAVVAEGITINAIPIVDTHPIGTFDGHASYAMQNWGLISVADFYRKDVIGGVGSFMVEADDYSAFDKALKRKLLMELLISQNDVAH